MEKRYTLVFDNVMIKQLKKAAKNQHIKDILTKMLDKLENLGLMPETFLIHSFLFMRLKQSIHLLGCISSTINKHMRFMYLNLR